MTAVRFAADSAEAREVLRSVDEPVYLDGFGEVRGFLVERVNGTVMMTVRFGDTPTVDTP